MKQLSSNDKIACIALEVVSKWFAGRDLHITLVPGIEAVITKNELMRLVYNRIEQTVKENQHKIDAYWEKLDREIVENLKTSFTEGWHKIYLSQERNK